MSAAKKIWWIASYPKSGNTWFRLALNAYVTQRPPDLKLPFDYVLQDLHTYYQQVVAAKPNRDLSQVEQILYRPAVLLHFIAGAGGRDLTVKTHHCCGAIHGVPLIPEPLTKAAVYIIRDPRDVAVSWAAHLGQSIDEAITSMADHGGAIANDNTGLLHVTASWSDHVKSWTMPEVPFPVTIVKYEDMLNDTEATFRTMFAAVGFKDLDEDRFHWALDQTTFGSLQRQERETGFKESVGEGPFFRSGKAGQWKDALTIQQAIAIENEHGEAMERFGYPPAIPF